MFASFVIFRNKTWLLMAFSLLIPFSYLEWGHFGKRPVPLLFVPHQRGKKGKGKQMQLVDLQDAFGSDHHLKKLSKQACL